MGIAGIAASTALGALQKLHAVTPSPHASGKPSFAKEVAQAHHALQPHDAGATAAAPASTGTATAPVPVP